MKNELFESMLMTDVDSRVCEEWREMIAKGTIPCFEFKTQVDEYLIVDISIAEDGKYLFFSFDVDGRPTWFSGAVDIETENTFGLPIDNDFSLDGHLQQIHDEIVEGYLLPNNLFCDKE